MKKILTFVSIITLSSFLVNSNVAAQEFNFNTANKNVRIKNNQIKKLLNKKVMRSLNKAAEDLLPDIVKTASGVYYQEKGEAVITSNYKNLNKEQITVLNFYILARVESELERKNQLAEENSFRLELYMDRRTKLLQTLSNIMDKLPAISDATVRDIR
ncbi:MAG: hypothetical protein GY834_08235 [Bacteroidetes bacterium]|nr:hypothetical protein [Bacteroidota bacterium]